MGRASRLFLALLAAAVALGASGPVCCAEEKATAPSPRRLPVAELQRWYGDELDLKGDDELARRVQEVEPLLDELFETQDLTARRKLVERVLAVPLPPAALRAAVRRGHAPQGACSAGYVQGQAAVPGFPNKQIPVIARIPQGYTHARAWPLIVDLHGAHGNGADYIKHWESGAKLAALEQFLVVAPTSQGPHGWGPSVFGRAHIPARVEIMPGRGHEVFADKNGEILEFFLKQPRQLCPAKVVHVSFDETPAARQYWVEVTRFVSAGNTPVTKQVLDNTRVKDPLLQKMQAAKTLAEHQALVQEAIRTGLVLEERTSWVQPREVVVTADRASNEITVERARFVGEVRILLDDALADLDKPVAVKQGGTAPATRKVVRSPRFLLEEALRAGRRDATYWGEITVAVRSTEGR